MNKETKLVNKIYSEDPHREWKRLVKDPFHKLEFDTTMRFLRKYLPRKAIILDAGGGPGRYSIELAKLGYDVVLLDLVKANLELAEKMIKKAGVEKKIKIIQGSITNLSQFGNNSFDAVLCLGGPLSHVHPKKQRAKAVSELVRVAKKNSPIFISVMGKLGTITRFYRWMHEVRDTAHFNRFCLEGDDYQWHGGKAYSHFFELEELKSLFNGKVKFLDFVGLEGLATPCQEQINQMAKKEKQAWKNWVDMHNKLCTKPMVAEFSLHFMVIGRKR